MISEPGQYDILREIKHLSEENNQMLHAMQRRAFVNSVFKFFMYVVFLGAPIWIYMTYMRVPVNNMLTFFEQTQSQTQGTKGQIVQHAPSSIGDMMRQLQSSIQGFQLVGQFLASTSTASSTQ